MSFKNTFSDLKKDLLITIFGGYKNGGYSKLIGLRDSLRKNNYKKTYLVRDLRTPNEIKKKKLERDAEIAEKSLHWAKKSQVGLFIFFKKVPYGSATVEMTIRLTTHEKLALCTSFFLEKGIDLQIVERGLIKSRKNYNVGYFDSKKDLYQMANTYCFHHMLQDNCSDTNFL